MDEHTRREDDARHLAAFGSHKGSGAAARAAGPPREPLRARLLLQVEGREPVEVYAFEPMEIWPGKPWGFYTHRRFRSANEPDPDALIETALTVEVRAHIAAEAADAPQPHPYAGGHDAPDPMCRDCGGSLSVSCTCLPEPKEGPQP